MVQATKIGKYAPSPKQDGPVVESGDFLFAAAFFDHPHIYGQVNGLAAAGGELRYVLEPDGAKVEPVMRAHPRAKRVTDLREILDDPEIRLVTAAAIPDLRCYIGIQVLDSGKDYFTDKCPVVSLEQLEKVKRKVAKTKRRYMVNYSERIESEAAWYAGELIKNGALGKVVQVLNLAPHRLGAEGRPGWFFEKRRYGGILTDIGSHQFEQFLEYTGATGAKINSARVENVFTPEYPEFEDFGEASLRLDTGASAYCRLDWFTPKGAKTWGDGRTFVLGTEGYLEIRKCRDLGRDDGDRIYLVDTEGEHVIDCKGAVGYPFFGKLVLDCLNRTETAMTQEHAFLAAELSLRAQAIADEGRKSSGFVTLGSA